MRALVLAVVVLLLCACTPDEDQDVAHVPPASAGATAGQSDPPTPPAWQTGQPSAVLTKRPLVLATNPRRGPIDVPEAVARWVIDGTITNWRDLGQPAAPLTVDDRSPARNLPMNTIAVGVADGVGPGVRVVAVDGFDPLREPDRYPIQVQGPSHGQVTTMTVVGDIMLGRGVGGGAALRPMADRLESADITIGNLESTLSDAGTPTQGDDSFHADPAVREDLLRAGFDVLGLANNHLGDYGDTALVETGQLLRNAGFETFGAGRDLVAARRPAVVERNGITFGFLGFNAIGETREAAPGQPGALSVSMPPRTGPLDRAELDRVLGDVRRLAKRVDVVVVLPHWGEQYTNEPWPEQLLVGRRLAAAGADLVVGGHPHWVQGASLVGDTLVVNSLGNFVFDMDGPSFTPDTMEGLVLEATFWDDRLMAADFVPYRMDADFAPRVVSRTDATRIYDRFWEFSGLGATR
ncbi:CapA family protein [Nocardioides sp. SR21]|uniref:CapA family protein n=1 Tax=Nocardioides sp. SR21 TaxID=2919501 RepID=UPI001FAA7E91|nr:CapA family protein [Nocardioides sp. SR21]